jgi:hypothetical protein
MKPYFNDKFKPICNNDVPVDTLLFGTDCTKKMKELGDYTKIPIGNPRFKSPLFLAPERASVSSAPAPEVGVWVPAALPESRASPV